MLCGESTLRRCMDQVLLLAQKLGFHFLPPEDSGSIRCWGDARGPLKAAIHRYVTTIYQYHDVCCDTVTNDKPLIVPLTGNRGNVKGRDDVQPFEVLGKWMGRYAMWQLDYANDLFIAKVGVGTLGKPEICYDVDAEIWE